MSASSNIRVVPVTVQHQSAPVPPQRAPTPVVVHPPPSTGAHLQRKTSVDDFSEKIVNMLDDIERRVEQLREQALSMEQEKEQLLELLSTVSMNTQMLRLGQGDRDDVEAITNRLLNRCRTVDVVVNTPRTQEQQKALHQVNDSIEMLVGKMQDDLENCKTLCKRYLNACSPDMPDGPIDQRFQSQVIECTADDQKKIRRRLAHVINLMERAQRTCVPSF